MQTHDIVVIGAGPAGLAAATTAAGFGLSVLLIDDQPAPGGQIYRNVERAEALGRAAGLGADYRRGASLTAALRASGVIYRPGWQVWQIEPEGRLFANADGQTEEIGWRRLVIAVGALERAVPIPGWTLPGVMTVGAAQILLKTGGVLPDEDVWIAGSGPLPLLYAAQVIAAGGRIGGFIDTRRSANRWRALAHLPGALRNWPYLQKAIATARILRSAGIPRITEVDAVEAVGTDRLTSVRWRRQGVWHEQKAGGLLLHEGVVPHVHMTMSLGCTHDWDPVQCCFRPRLDAWGRTDTKGVIVAGDAGGIFGARAAEIRGRLAALGAAAELGKVPPGERDRQAAAWRRELGGHIAIRPFLDHLFAPSPFLLAPADDVVLCRCEGATAGQIREAVDLGCLGPNQVKSFTRAGMGPCQGRICGLPVTTTIAAARGVSPAEIGFFRVRPPLKPLTLGEVAALLRDDVPT